MHGHFSLTMTCSIVQDHILLSNSMMILTPHYHDSDFLPATVPSFSFMCVWLRLRIEGGPGWCQRPWTAAARSIWDSAQPSHSQDSRLCGDITVLRAFRILQRPQCWVRQSKQGERGKIHLQETIAKADRGVRAKQCMISVCQRQIAAMVFFCLY